MPDARDLPVVRWGEELRRARLWRRSRLVRTLVAVGATVAVVLPVATLVQPPEPLLVWNASASSPIGLYSVTKTAEIRPGMMVVAWPPDKARRLADGRRYLPSSVPLVKRVAAIAGDGVCAVGEALFVNGELRARRRVRDGQGRRLSWWTGCITLEKDQLILLSGSGFSFDGRYFGVTRAGEIIGRARPLWIPARRGRDGASPYCVAACRRHGLSGRA